MDIILVIVESKEFSKKRSSLSVNPKKLDRIKSSVSNTNTDKSLQGDSSKKGKRRKTELIIRM